MLKIYYKPSGPVGTLDMKLSILCAILLNPVNCIVRQVKLLCSFLDEQSVSERWSNVTKMTGLVGGTAWFLMYTDPRTCILPQGCVNSQPCWRWMIPAREKEDRVQGTARGVSRLSTHPAPPNHVAGASCLSPTPTSQQPDLQQAEGMPASGSPNILHSAEPTTCQDTSPSCGTHTTLADKLGWITGPSARNSPPRSMWWLRVHREGGGRAGEPKSPRILR